MNIQLFFSTFLLIFLAELGDKTQLAAFTLAAKEKAPGTIFLAAMLGFVLSTFLAVFLGSIATKFIPTAIVEKAAAVGFIVVGVLLFFKKL